MGQFCARAVCSTTKSNNPPGPPPSGRNPTGRQYCGGYFWNLLRLMMPTKVNGNPGCAQMLKMLHFAEITLTVCNVRDSPVTC